MVSLQSDLAYPRRYALLGCRQLIVLSIVRSVFPTTIPYFLLAAVLNSVQ